MNSSKWWAEKVLLYRLFLTAGLFLVAGAFVWAIGDWSNEASGSEALPSVFVEEVHTDAFDCAIVRVNSSIRSIQCFKR